MLIGELQVFIDKVWLLVKTLIMEQELCFARKRHKLQKINQQK